MLSAIRRRKRLVLLIVIGVLLLALSWWRSPQALRPSDDFTVSAVAIPEPPADAPLSVTHIWDIEGAGAGFGGFSALIAMPDAQLRSFSDRNWRFTFTITEDGPTRMTTEEVVPAAGYGTTLHDVESATETADGSAYWLSYEATHAIHRYADDDAAQEVRLLGEEVDLPMNSGLEAITRLADDRFVAFAEAGNSGFLFSGDPTEGAALSVFPVEWPREGFSPTDSAQLPDGRVLVLMRRFTAFPWPEFACVLVIGDPPRAEETWEPELLVDLDALLPQENYEGMAIRGLADGSAELWLISDDNFSAFQRTLLARLVYVP